jgi:hypothetical protein
MFNDVWTNNNVGRMLNWGPGSATFYLFNVTMECGRDSNNATGTCLPGSQTTLTMYNDHFIASGMAYQCTAQAGSTGTCKSFTNAAGTANSPTFSAPPNPMGATDTVVQTKAKANGQGYSYSSPYQFSPTLGNGVTVGKGTNQAATCNLINDSAAQAACKSDTTYAVTYNQSNHTAVPSSRVPKSRPSGAWDIGAYQVAGGSSGNSVAAPSALQAIIQTP